MNRHFYNKKRLHYYFFLILLAGGLIIPSGCERQEPWESFDCASCYQDKPDMGPLQIMVTINKANPAVPLVIYNGKLEDNDIEFSDTAYSADYSVDVPVDRYYSVKAEYRDGGNTIYAVDGDKLKLKKNVSDCDAECYYFKGGYIDVRLME